MIKINWFTGEKSQNCFLIPLTICWFFILFPFIIFGQNDLFFHPKRVVFKEGKRYQEVYLANTRKDTVRYTISIEQMKENEDFQIMNKPEPNHNSIYNNFRFFPNQVVLGPNESKVLKMQIVNEEELVPVESRYYLYLRAKSENRPLGDVDVQKNTKTAPYKDIPISDITIPVIVKSKKGEVQVSLFNSTMEINENGAVLKCMLRSRGNIAAYGDIVVEYTEVNSGYSHIVGKVNDLEVSVPNIVRHIQIELYKIEGIDLKKGFLQATYFGPDQFYFSKQIKL